MILLYLVIAAIAITFIYSIVGLIRDRDKIIAFGFSGKRSDVPE